MPLPSPRLDDRTFADLTAEAAQLIGVRCPTWTDRSPHDPGMVLVEAFAYLTEVLLYRLNRLPEKAYVELLRLLGVTITPPSAAVATLVFSLPGPAEAPVVIPRGTQATSRRPGAAGAPAVFATADETVIPAGQREATARAFHCDVVEGELLGVGTGLPGQSYAVSRPPIVAQTGDDLDLVVAVEATPQELSPDVPSLTLGDKAYRVWREVSRVADGGSDRFVYVADRFAGTISFAPAVSLVDVRGVLEPVPTAHDEVPARSREIRAWYRRGGGAEGNVGAGEIAALKAPLRSGPSLTVTNREPAMGGRPAETVANAMLRGPEELRALRRAVTAADFERLARRAGGVARARAVAQAALWRHGRPGTVEVLLVPELPDDVRGPSDAGVGAAALRDHQGSATLTAIQGDLDARRPLGTQCVVSWARYKTVTVKATVRAHRAADRAAVRERVRGRLHRYIDPLPAAAGDGAGWGFGEPLPASTVYHLIQSEPGVARVESLSFLLDEVPAAASALAADGFQPDTWYAGSGEALYRSVSNGDGWELVGRFPGERIELVAAHPGHPGLLAVAARLPAAAGEAERSRVRLSVDCGETWLRWDRSLPAATDLAWTLRDGAPLLLVSTAKGLWELAVDEAAQPLPVTVDPSDPDLPLHAVAAATDARGNWMCAVAAQDRKGIYLSEKGGEGGSFKKFGLEGEDARRLEVQQEGVRTRLWAGLFATNPDDPGHGAFMRELTGAGGWRRVDQGWDGGSCFALAFDGPIVYAATHHMGVLVLDVTQPDDAQWAWVKPTLGCGLPVRERDRIFQPVVAVAARGGLALVAGGLGVLRRQPGQGPGAVLRPETPYRSCSETEVRPDLLPLPSTWLFCSGPHQIDMVGP
jgi:hypothetical protein